MGANDGSLPIMQLDDALRREKKILIFAAATGSEKIQMLANWIQLRIQKKLLILNPSTIGVRNTYMHISAACYRTGADRGDGCEIQHARVVCATVGVVVRCYGTGGSKFLKEFDGVIFEEMDKMTVDPQYAMLWDVIDEIAKEKCFFESGSIGHFQRRYENGTSRDGRRMDPMCEEIIHALSQHR
jgi:hypothetical protein